MGFVDWYICEKILEICICLWPEFDCPEVTLCGWQVIKIQLLLLLASWTIRLDTHRTDSHTEQPGDDKNGEHILTQTAAPILALEMFRVKNAIIVTTQTSKNLPLLHFHKQHPVKQSRP